MIIFVAEILDTYNIGMRPFDQAVTDALIKLNSKEEIHGRKHIVNIETKKLEPEESEIKDNNLTKEDIRNKTKYYARLEYILELKEEEKKLIIYDKVYEIDKYQFKNNLFVPQLYTDLMIDCFSAYASLAKSYYESKQEVAV